jgi:hypothetical protein
MSISAQKAGLSSPSRFTGAMDPAQGSPRAVLISAHSEQDFADIAAASPAIGSVPKVLLSARLIRQMLGQA